MPVSLHNHTPWSFLDGASDIDALVRRAAGFGMPALAMTDHNSVSAAVKFTQTCISWGIRPILGAEITMEDESHLTLLAQNRIGYGNLCRLLSAAYQFGGRLTPALPWQALGLQPTGGADMAMLDVTGLFCLSGCRKGRLWQVVCAHNSSAAQALIRGLQRAFGSQNFFVELQQDFTPDSSRVNNELAGAAHDARAGLVATNNVHYATPEDFAVHDLLRCVGAGVSIAQNHSDRPLNNERYLLSPDEMQRRFSAMPQAVENTQYIAERCEAALPDCDEITPRYTLPHGYADAAAYLCSLTWRGAEARYRPVTPAVKRRIEHELAVIVNLGYADYFLMAWRVALWARRQGIRCTGRGSAADSCVAFCLMLTDVDVISRGLPFARFLTEGKTPDIDLDFPSDRRDEVFQHITQSYGAANVASVCTFHTYRSKSAVRDMGKALALPAQALEWFSGHLSSFIHADELHAAFEKQPELREYAGLRNRFDLLFRLCARIADFPRHIGTHSSGIVISRVPLSQIAPLRPSARGVTQIWELDKDDAEAVGAIKLDVLSLRTLSAVSDAEATLQRQDPAFRYNRIPIRDDATYQLLRAGAAVGAFQLESAAQLSLAVTLQPEHFEDLVASVALIRPGPVRGDAVQRFVACRNGSMRAEFLHPCLVPILAKTYGTIIFQEQAILVIAAMTGCSEADADRVRKSLAKHARHNTMHEVREAFVRDSCRRHPDFDARRANLLFDMLEGWSGYGFTEGHAASFAITAWRTSWLTAHHVAAWYAGMMSHQPMGFYSANSLAAEARRRGVTILPLDINESDDRCTAPDAETIRLGLRLASGLREADIAVILAARQTERFQSLLDFAVRAPLHRDAVENLVLSGAFDALHLHRRGLLWRLDETLALAQQCRVASTGSVLVMPAMMETPLAQDVAPFSPWDAYLWTWRLTGVCAECHVFAWMREALAAHGVMTTADAMRERAGSLVTVAGLNIRPHRPPTKSGAPVLFSTLEDEFGLLQTVCVGKAIDSCTATFLTAAAIVARGVVERRGVGVTLRILQVRPLRLQEFVPHEANRPLAAEPAPWRAYTGTQISVQTPHTV
ncbi:MAG: DNA polymerase III subunit alpha [Armatimonadetes bacterium]|nr:DNA polymerase III subunit alpha [Armatimonadota bacterium]MDE2207935.1 DNA polymerase III subunit alpha [Armatimonadota bacterium]